MVIAEPSVQSLFLVCYSEQGNVLGSATGFVVLHKGNPYLITNYHVLAGRSPDDGQPLHLGGATTARVRVVQLSATQQPGRLEWEPRDELVLDPTNGSALWFEHPLFGRRVDVVALPLTQAQNIKFHPYDLTLAQTISAAPADGVSIVGFPFGRAGGGAFAIWTRGFIASEPDIDQDQLPRFLIDARTRSGQSGSPVIIWSNGGAVTMMNGHASIFGGPAVNLLGVYSGRVPERVDPSYPGTQAVSTDLGYVWKIQVVRDILEGGVPGRSGL